MNARNEAINYIQRTWSKPTGIVILSLLDDLSLNTLINLEKNNFDPIEVICAINDIHSPYFLIAFGRDFDKEPIRELVSLAEEIRRFAAQVEMEMLEALVLRDGILTSVC